MLKTFKYRHYPTKRQERLLTEQLEEVRWLWNTLLAERKSAWEERQEAVLYYDQRNALPTLKTTLRRNSPFALASLKSTLSLCKMSSAVCRRRRKKATEEGDGRLLPSPESGREPRRPRRPRRPSATHATQATGARDAMIRSPTLSGTTASNSARVANGSISPRSGM